MKEKIIGIVNELQFSVIKSDEDLDKPFDELGDNGLDSLDIAEICIEIENKLEVTFYDDCDIDKTNSINDLIKIINDKQQIQS